MGEDYRPLRAASPRSMLGKASNRTDGAVVNSRADLFASMVKGPAVEAWIAHAWDSLRAKTWGAQ